MRRRHTRLACLVGALAALPPLWAPARADGLKITGVTVGIAGHYRPGGWVPVTVTVANTGSGSAHGQVELARVGPGSGAVFAQPIDVSAAPGPQTFRLDVRGLDPSREEVTARLVTGAARGDGAALAEADSASASGPNVFSGVPVADKDLLLVGFSADPSAFTPLDGRQWGLTHAAAGVTAEAPSPAPVPPYFRGRFRPAGRFRFSSPTLTPARAQVAAAGAADLPDRPAAYAGVDAVLLRADAPLDALSEAQADALRAWVATGGRLVVCGGADPALLSGAFFSGLLPASVMSAPPGPGAVGETLTPKPLPGVRVLASASGRPTAVAGPYGAGQVTVLAFDPTQPASQAQAGPALWRAVFAAGPSSLLPVVAAREESDFSRFGFYNGPQGRLAEAAMRAPALDVPGADVVGLFLFAYVLILVPVNYLVLKRLDKKEWAWATIPGLVALFAVGTYAVGYAAHGSRVFVNRAAILEAAAGQRQAGVYAAVGLFSPRRTSYDLTLADPAALAAVSAPPNTGYNNYRRSQPADGYGPARVVEGDAGAQVQDAAVNMWAMRAFDTQTATDLGGAVTSTLSLAPPTRQLRGALTNRTPHALRGCQLLIGGSWVSVGDLSPGASYSPPPLVAYSATASSWGNMAALGGHAAVGALDPDVRQRMHTALADFARGLGGQNNQYQYYAGNYSAPAAFTPRPGEAILIGWSDDPALAGPPVRVDGHPATENDVTLVVVHVPLR